MADPSAQDLLGQYATDGGGFYALPPPAADEPVSVPLDWQARKAAASAAANDSGPPVAVATQAQRLADIPMSDQMAMGPEKIRELIRLGVIDAGPEQRPRDVTGATPDAYAPSPWSTHSTPARAVAAAQRRETPAAPAGPPPLPGFGPGAGGIYPEDYRERLASIEKLNPAQYASEKGRYDRWSSSMPGLQVQQVRDAQRQSAVDAGFAGENIETQREALQQSQAARAEADQAAQLAEQQRERARQAERAELERKSQQLEQMNAELAGGKIDPDRYWKNQNGGSALLSMISVALGGFAEGFSGGKVKNQGIEMIQNAINRDIAAQQSDMQNKRAGYDNQRGLFQLARERFGDNEMAANYARAKMNEHVERVVQGIAADAKDKTYQTALDKLASDAKFAKEQNELALKLGMAQAATGAGHAAAAGVKPLTPDEQARTINVSLGDGSTAQYRFGNAAQAKEAQDRITAKADLHQALGEMQRLGKAGMVRTPEFTSAHTRAKIAYADAMGLKESQRTDDILEAAIPKNARFIDTGEGEAWNGAQRQVDSRISSFLGSSVATPTATGIGANKTGTALEQQGTVLAAPDVRAPIGFDPVGANTRPAEPESGAKENAMAPEGVLAAAAARRREAR